MGEHIWKDFVAGGSAGIIEISIMYPLDVVKTRNQLATTRSTGIFQTLAHVVKEQGPLGLYRGILSPMLAEAPKRAWKFPQTNFSRSLLVEKGK
jgi:solute carrier family 25 2-oxodicarboxylate transporter 21